MTIEIIPPGRAGLTDPKRCQYTLCRQEAEYAVELPEVEEVLVCSLHVTPVVVWGKTDGERGARIRDLVPPARWAG